MVAFSQIYFSFAPLFSPNFTSYIPKNKKKPQNIILGTTPNLIRTRFELDSNSRRRDPDELSSSGYSSSAINAEYYPVSTETMDTGDYELYDPRIHAKPRLQIQPRKTIRPEVVKNYP